MLLGLFHVPSAPHLPSCQTAAVCREMLNAMSFNVPVAAKMARNEDILQELAQEVLLHVSPLLNEVEIHENRMSSTSEPTDFEEPSADPAVDHKDSDASDSSSVMEGPSKSTWRRLMGLRRGSGGRGSLWGADASRKPEDVTEEVTASEESEGTDSEAPMDLSDDEDDGFGAVERGAGEGWGLPGNATFHGDTMSAQTVAAHMHRTASALRALRNVLRACQSDPSGFGYTARASGLPRSILWPLRLLYGHGKEEQGGEGASNAKLEGTVDINLVHSLMLMLDGIATSGLWTVITHPPQAAGRCLCGWS